MVAYRMAPAPLVFQPDPVPATPETLIRHSAVGHQKKEMLDGINTENRRRKLRKIIFTQEKSGRKKEVLLSTQVLGWPAFYLLQIKVL